MKYHPALIQRIDDILVRWVEAGFKVGSEEIAKRIIDTYELHDWMQRCKGPAANAPLPFWADAMYDRLDKERPNGPSEK